jgi:hypothetical protein
MKKKPKPNAAKRQLEADWQTVQTRWQTAQPFARTSPTGRIPQQPVIQNLPMPNVDPREVAALRRICSRVTQAETPI